MPEKVLFIDRDGTLIHEPDDHQVDALDKVRLVDDVIPSLLELANHGYRFVMITNQDGLGTDSYPLDDFHPAHDKMLSLFATQGIEFAAQHIDPHFEEDGSPDRKPGIGMVLEYLKSGELDLDAAAGNVQIDITDEYGQLVQRLNLGQQTAGMVHFNWDGITSSGEQAPAGHYQVSARVIRGAEVESTPTLIEADIQSVTLGRFGSGMTLNLSGGNALSLSQVYQIT